MKPTTTKKAGETASYGGRGKRQYFAGKKKLIKRRKNKADRRDVGMDLLIASMARTDTF